MRAPAPKTVAKLRRDSQLDQRRQGTRFWTVAFIPQKAPDLATIHCLRLPPARKRHVQGYDESRKGIIGELRATFLNSLGKERAQTRWTSSPQLIEGLSARLFERIVEGMLDRDATGPGARSEPSPAKPGKVMTRREFVLRRTAQRRSDGKRKCTVKQPGSYLVLIPIAPKALRVAPDDRDKQGPEGLYHALGMTEKGRARFEARLD